ncbi:MAG TPA: hypothetical protein VLT89_00340 [Usitatibacter sp.]|nr:hypothetical protein [Usitatibacter sp.]
MTLKQQLATAFLATLIVCSVGFAPSNAEMPGSKVPAPAASKSMSVRASSELPQDQVRDLTYN